MLKKIISMALIASFLNLNIYASASGGAEQKEPLIVVVNMDQQDSDILSILCLNGEGRKGNVGYINAQLHPDVYEADIELLAGDCSNMDGRDDLYLKDLIISRIHEGLEYNAGSYSQKSYKGASNPHLVYANVDLPENSAAEKFIESNNEDEATDPGHYNAGKIKSPGRRTKGTGSKYPKSPNKSKTRTEFEQKKTNHTRERTFRNAERRLRNARWSNIDVGRWYGEDLPGDVEIKKEIEALSDAVFKLPPFMVEDMMNFQPQHRNAQAYNAAPDIDDAGPSTDYVPDYGFDSERANRLVSVLDKLLVVAGLLFGFNQVSGALKPVPAGVNSIPAMVNTKAGRDTGSLSDSLI